MNDRKQVTQVALFESESPDWRSLPCEAQQSVLDILSQMLRDALEQRCSDSVTTSPPTTENNDVS